MCLVLYSSVTRLTLEKFYCFIPIYIDNIYTYIHTYIYIYIYIVCIISKGGLQTSSEMDGKIFQNMKLNALLPRTFLLQYNQAPGKD